MSDEREIWHPVTTYHAGMDAVTIPPNETLGVDHQIPALQVTLWTTSKPHPDPVNDSGRHCAEFAGIFKALLFCVFKI